MNNLTKAQVIALFLGTASANLAALNQVATPTGTTVRATSAGGACLANGTCAAAGQVCASIQSGATGAVVAGTGECVAEWTCGALGRLANVPFSVNCWTAVATGETAAAPATVDAAAYFTAIEGMITKLTVNFDSERNIIISPMFNYLDGWWTKADDTATTWTETDKPSDNRCFLDLQCPADECCSQYPDAKNRRCIKKTANKIALTLGPATMTPSCPSLDTGTTGGTTAPENAQDDLADTALAKANEALTTWQANQLADAKKAAGYDTTACDQACKDKFDAAEKVKADARTAFITEMKTLAKFDDASCNATCKEIFQVDLLKWEKAVYETCKADEKAIGCREANAIREDTETDRATTTYYTGTAEKRTEFDTARKEKDAALESTLTAAFIKNNKPKSGEVGSDCKAETSDDLLAVLDADDYSCPTATHCCGDATPKDGAFVNAKIEKICNTKEALTFTDGLNREYTFKCLENAIKLASTATAAVLAAYYM